MWFHSHYFDRRSYFEYSQFILLSLQIYHCCAYSERNVLSTSRRTSTYTMGFAFMLLSINISSGIRSLRADFFEFFQPDLWRKWWRHQFYDVIPITITTWPMTSSVLVRSIDFLILWRHPYHHNNLTYDVINSSEEYWLFDPMTSSLSPWQPKSGLGSNEYIYVTFRSFQSMW